jgi:hypothetical protein
LKCVSLDFEKKIYIVGKIQENKNIVGIPEPQSNENSYIMNVEFSRKIKFRLS